jgi:type I restriction enzyme R subunit
MTDRGPEKTRVELPFIEQLVGLGWTHGRGDEDVAYLTGRASFREVLLKDRLSDAIRRINVGEEGEPWLDDARVEAVVSALERISGRLMEANQTATHLLLKGTVVEGNPALHGGHNQTVRYIDFDHPERNDFLVVDQFRVEAAGRDPIIPDLVLFVNGIPLVVAECKSPSITDPMEAGVDQLLRYTNNRPWVEEDEGVEKLFHYNQFMVSTYFYGARTGTVGAAPEHYLEWKDTSPVPMEEVAQDLGVENLKSQQTLVAGMLRPENLLSIVRNFVLHSQAAGRTIKIVARYQQFRAVQKAVHRLQTGKTRLQTGKDDERGGVVWHTQGSGKSLTMVFLVRQMRTLPELRRFKIVAVTDRTDLQKQLQETAALIGEPLRRAADSEDLKVILSQEGADLVFAMMQKVQEREAEAIYSELNDSEDILLLVDEAHRTQSSTLHANLRKALKNAARIGFTGTPIMVKDRKSTQEIFGPFIDRYTIGQSEADGSTVPILYEGRTTDAVVADERTLDELFEDMFRDRTPEELEALKRKYATEGDVLEAEKFIAAKARNMLRHYVEAVLPNGLKAQVVATSRLAAVRYQKALAEAHETLLADLDGLDPLLLTLSEEALERSDPETRFLIRAYPHLDDIRRLEFAAVISGDHNDPPGWAAWTADARRDEHVARFKKPLDHDDPAKRDGLAFLCVKSMLLTGFDAPVEGVLYLDRSMRGHELLQAIARVNRTHPDKEAGLVVDYYGVTRHLEKALEDYGAEDVGGAMTSLVDELPILDIRHRRVLAVFTDRGLDISDTEACVDLLRDVEARADFAVKLKQFARSLDTVLPRPEALPYVPDARTLGLINKIAANLYRDPQLNVLGAGQKVRELIDAHLEASGIDPKVPPISITDPDFARAVEGHGSERAKASEMEHAARHHISVHYREDPAHYKKLSERLEQILKSLEGRWAELVEALRNLTEDIRAGRPADDTGLDPRTQAPFLGVLADRASAGGEGDGASLEHLAALTVRMVDLVRRSTCTVDFWRNVYKQNRLRGDIVEFLDSNDVVPFDEQEAVADEVVELAKSLHARLCP